MAIVVVDEQQKIIRISKEDLFDDLKSDHPTEFGSKVYEDVDTIKEDEGDTSFIAITFKKESA